ncbi:unnamed protein product [Linum tenue]|uniref:Uncharacterized protein n=1 Tax=Linum tenue TaxID=586396 RepID=A0AAV0QWX2_9ROSI|nr:unnamed protein product [Linum tenue]
MLLASAEGRGEANSMQGREGSIRTESRQRRWSSTLEVEVFRNDGIHLKANHVYNHKASPMMF